MKDTSVSLLDRLRSVSQPDSDDWKRFVDLYTPFVQQWLRRYGLTGSDADDLVQDVLTVLVRDLPRFEHNNRRGAFRSWLRTITVNRLRNFWRARRYQPIVGGLDFAAALEELADPVSELSRQWDEEHDRHVVRRLLELIEDRFEPVTLRVFCRLVYDEQKPAEVAAELGITLNAVFLAKSRVLRELRNELNGLTD
jgi:RNA polymerase sigma-70 factor (ECF subfamily)